MKPHLIAVIKDENNQTQGYRIISDHGVSNMATIALLNDASLNRDGALANAKIENGKVIGTNGSIDRYPVIINKQLASKSALTVLAKYENGSFMVADFKGATKTMRQNEAVAYAKENGISNGKIVPKGDKEIISAIQGEYEVTIVDLSKEMNKGAGEFKPQTMAELMRTENHKTFIFNKNVGVDSVDENVQDASVKLTKAYWNKKGYNCDVIETEAEWNNPDAPLIKAVKVFDADTDSIIISGVGNFVLTNGKRLKVTLTVELNNRGILVKDKSKYSLREAKRSTGIVGKLFGLK